MKIQVYLKILFLIILFGCLSAIEKPLEPNIIPKPLSQKIEISVFIMDKNASLETFGAFKNVANYLNSDFLETYSFKLPSNKSDNQIVFISDNRII